MDKEKNIGIIMDAAGAETENQKVRVTMCLHEEGKGFTWNPELGRNVECFKRDDGFWVDEFGNTWKSDIHVTLDLY
jgi:hypothetical protein